MIDADVIKWIESKKIVQEDEKVSEQAIITNCQEYDLSDLLSLKMQNDKTKPFRYWKACDGMRSFDIEDLTEQRASYLYDILDKIEDPFVKARISDVLWCSKKLIKKHNYNAAKIAIKSYFNCIDIFVKNDLFEASRYMTRVSNLANSLKGSDEKKALSCKVSEYIKIDYMCDKNKMYRFLYECLNIISECDFPEKSECKPHYEKTLKVIDDIKEYDIANPLIHCFYEVAIKLSKKSGEAHEYDLRIKAANTYELQAEKSPIKYTKIELLKSALAEYKKINKKDEVDRITLEIEKIGNPMNFKVGEVKIPPFEPYTINKISGKSFRDAVFGLMIFQLPNKEEIKEIYKKKKESRTALYLWHPVSYFDADGKTVANFSSEEEILEYWTNCDATIYYYQRVYHNIILPGLETIQQEHKFSWEDIRELIEDSSVIPKEHSESFAKGISHFFKGELMEASYLLIPKVEHYLRHLLSQRGELVSNIKDDGTEESITNIKNLLQSCVEKGIFPDDLAWILNLYLCDPIVNLRNRMAHGKLRDEEANGMNSYVLCYIIFCLVFSY